MSTEHFLTEAEIKVIDSATQTLTSINQKFKDLGLGVEGEKARLQKFSSDLRTVGLAAASAGAAILGGAGLAVSAAAEQARANAQLDAVLRSTGHAAGLNATEIKKMATSLQEVTNFSDEAITGGANLLLTFKNIGKDVFPQATEAMLNISEAMGTDLKSAAIQVGKALNEPIQGMSALSRVGIQFTQQQKDQVKALIESGKGLEAQKIILKELESQFGGMARAVATPMQQIKNQLNEVMEAIGNALLPVVKELTAAIIPYVQAAAAWINNHQALVGVIAKVVVVAGALLTVIGAVSGVIGVLTPVWTALTGVAAGFLAPVAAVIAGLALLTAWVTKTETGHRVFAATVQFLSGVISTVVQWLKNTALMMQAVWNVAAPLREMIGKYLVAEFNKLTAVAGAVANALGWVWARIKDVGDIIRTYVIDKIKALIGLLERIPGVGKLIGDIKVFISDVGDEYQKLSQSADVSTEAIKEDMQEITYSAGAMSMSTGESAGAASDKLKELKKTIEGVTKSYYEGVITINRQLLTMKGEHTATMKDLNKQLVDLEKQVTKLSTTYAKDMADILDAHNKTMDGLNDSKATAIAESYQKILDLRAKLEEAKGKAGSLNTDQIINVTENRQDKGKELSQRDISAFNLSDDQAEQVNLVLKMRIEQEALQKVLQQNYDLTQEQGKSLKETYGDTQLENIKKIIEANKDLKKASDYGNLTDLEKKFVDIGKTTKEENDKFKKTQDEKNASFKEESDKLKENKKDLLDKMATEDRVYTATRKALLDTRTAMQTFHNDFLENVKDVTKVTSEQVDILKAKLEEMKNTISSIDALIKAKESITGGNTVTSQAKTRGVAKSANGNVFTQHSITEIAEGDRPEAVVPLPDGRTIPVTINAPAGGGNSISISFGAVTIKNDMDVREVARTIVTAVDNQLLKSR